jgi:hypothetical protein
MFNGKKLAGVTLIAVSGLLFSLSSSFSNANAETATTDTSVVTEELCTWYMLGAPSTIALTPAVPGTEYEGDAILVSDSFEEADSAELNVYSSGNVTSGSRSTHGNCTFYSAATRPTVTMSISDGDFTATANIGGADTVMDFSAATGNELVVDQTSTCDGKWTTADLSLKTAALSGVPLTIPTLSTVDARVTGTGNDRCKADFTVKINIPGSKTPTYAGQTYSWSGPSFTTALTTDNS